MGVNESWRFAHRDFWLPEIFHRQRHATEHLGEEQRLRGGIEHCREHKRTGVCQSGKVDKENEEKNLVKCQHIQLILGESGGWASIFFFGLPPVRSVGAGVDDRALGPSPTCVVPACVTRVKG